MKYNACIQILSSRTICLEYCLKTIYQFYNYKYDYPVYIHYFDDIYDSQEYRDKIHNTISPNIHFISIPYETPSHIKEQELFYNRKDISYVRRSFSIGRKGYLHMCHFISNMYKYSNTVLHEYDYIIVYDDESGYIKESPYDFVEIMSNRSEDMGALTFGQRLEGGKPKLPRLDTRIGLWEFTKNFLQQNGIVPKSKLLQDLMKDKNAEQNYHSLPSWADTYVIKTKMFETNLWKKWIAAVNQNGGIYKFRWGDNEIYSLFYLIYDDKPVYNFRAAEEGYFDSVLFRHVQNKKNWREMRKILEEKGIQYQAWCGGVAPNVRHPER